ncbi:MAG: hypothetical protein IJW62_06040, partial [Clostridia bacterium]|nr:hypothetical protein [Clostridia bacterium]
VAILYLVALVARLCLPRALIPISRFRIFGGSTKYHFQQSHRLDVYRSILLYGTAISFLFGTAFLAIEIEALVF